MKITCVCDSQSPEGNVWPPSQNSLEEALPYIGNSWTHCAEVWNVIRYPIAKHLKQVMAWVFYIRIHSREQANLHYLCLGKPLDPAHKVALKAGIIFHSISLVHHQFTNHGGLLVCSMHSYLILLYCV